jgi:hypothetical protein
MKSLKKIPGNKVCKFAFVFSLMILNIFIISPATALPGLHKIVTVEDTPLKAFEGIYQFKDNEFAYFQITAVNDKLLVKQIEGNQQFTLTRKSEFTFETKDDDGDETISVVFSKNDAGEITQATVAGKQLYVKVKSYVPVKEIKLTPGQLKAFEGKYQFEEKSGTFLQITATADGLMLKQLWDNREINFIAVADLTFLNKQMGFPLKCTKDQAGNVIKVLAFNRDLWDKVKE